MRRRVLEALQASFRPEFLNRVDDLVVFNPLGRKEISRIIDLQLERLQALLAERKIHVELAWEYDIAHWSRPWRITGGGLEASFTPFYDKVTRTNLGIVSSRTDQCFGHWSGTFAAAGGDTIAFDGILGWAEEVHNRW